MDASSIGIDAFTLSLNFDTHSNTTNKDTKEYDITAEYAYSDTLNFNTIYSDIDDPYEAFSNLRIFMNYRF